MFFKSTEDLQNIQNYTKIYFNIIKGLLNTAFDGCVNIHNSYNKIIINHNACPKKAKVNYYYY